MRHRRRCIALIILVLVHLPLLRWILLYLLPIMIIWTHLALIALAQACSGRFVFAWPHRTYRAHPRLVLGRGRRVVTWRTLLSVAAFVALYVLVRRCRRVGGLTGSLCIHSLSHFTPPLPASILSSFLFPLRPPWVLQTGHWNSARGCTR